jgi:serine/threonine-protein kinase HipA
MVIMGNCDAHLKNWSLRYPGGRTPTFAPAYDLVCTTVYENLPARLTFPLGGTRRPNSIGTAEFARVADAASCPVERALDVVRDTADRLRRSWPALRHEASFPELVAHIDHRLDRHPLTALHST